MAEHARWLADNGEARRYDFPALRPGDVVVDLGGYQGQWAAGILDRYDVQMHVFEAHPGFAADLARRFAGDPRVKVHPVALGAADGEFTIADDGDASGASGANATVRCRSVEASSYLQAIGVAHVAVLKINIEGGEYEVLPRLIESGFIAHVDLIQVQFHRYGKADEDRRNAIVGRLDETHEQVWCYAFVWEEWRRKAGRHRDVSAA
ncbi:FkbM family methyltransferase [Aminobacter aminovorans]|uniref:Methyltransferase, FkbM family n=2 Tax=Aminobacter aminovorans TaxID=83263 RepID=A0A380WP83_AMIAI|nr:FkbM family methyltransferase [Aminobacter aminovorans]SUU90661.1 methyltransferase, FkbM family [Aminobacter aminovorans]